MSFFGSIVDRIVQYAEGATGVAHPAAPTPSPATSSGGPAPSGMPAGSAPTPAPTTALPSVDIGAVLAKRATAQGGDLRWQTSIVDLLKVLDLDSSLSARKQLAAELDVHAGSDGSAEENTALHRAVVAKLVENGGNVPTEMKA